MHQPSARCFIERPLQCVVRLKMDGSFRIVRRFRRHDLNCIG
jgi:hypothetical protein